jgi:hypothetical protein
MELFDCEFSNGFVGMLLIDSIIYGIFGELNLASLSYVRICIPYLS